MCHFARARACPLLLFIWNSNAATAPVNSCLVDRTSVFAEILSPSPTCDPVKHLALLFSLNSRALLHLTETLKRFVNNFLASNLFLPSRWSFRTRASWCWNRQRCITWIRSCPRGSELDWWVTGKRVLLHEGWFLRRRSRKNRYWWC